MLFNSWPFIFVFLPICLVGFHLLAARSVSWAKAWLIASSLFFYAYWKVEYLPILVGSIAFNFSVARMMALSSAEWHRRMLLVAGLTANLSLLGYFKYTNFFLATLRSVGVPAPGPLDIVLPLAISFFTFTQIAYLVDVYRDKSLRYPLLDYTFFVVFFPHLIAGPIVRHNEILPQLKQWSKSLNLKTLAVGLALFILGLSKKCFFADSLAPHVENVYNAAAHGTIISMRDAWLGTLVFALQIYLDFSAYSDMALGLALMFGLRFPVNFNSPYQATTIIEFWSRWHMTLTRFLREYVYFTLGGNRCGRVRQIGNILITMLLSGIWHGAGWAFLIWGGLHGLYLAVAHAWREWRKSWRLEAGPIEKGLGAALTFVAIIIAWVWFRAGHVGTAYQLTLSMLGLHSAHTALIGPILSLTLPAILLMVWLMPNTQQLLERYHPAWEPDAVPGRWSIRLNFPTAVVLGMLFFWVTREFFVSKSTLFIYFKF